LIDLPSKRVFYTWSNHQAENPIIRKLERAIVNDLWLASYPSSMAVFDPPGDSDHAPCIILSKSSRKDKKNPLSTSPFCLPTLSFFLVFWLLG